MKSLNNKIKNSWKSQYIREIWSTRLYTRLRNYVYSSICIVTIFCLDKHLIKHTLLWSWNFYRLRTFSHLRSTELQFVLLTWVFYCLEIFDNISISLSQFFILMEKSFIIILSAAGRFQFPENTIHFAFN